MMTTEVFTFLLSPRGIATILFLASSGVFVGWSCRILGITLWSLVILFIGLGMTITSDYYYTLLRIGSTGALASSDFNGITIAIMCALLLIYGSATCLGSASRSHAEAEQAENAAKMQVDDFLDIINTAAAHPVLGQGGWLVTRWGAMEARERRSWVAKRLHSLRDIERKMRGQGIEALGVDLPGVLASLDQQHRTWRERT